jgi:hypothetical protein
MSTDRTETASPTWDDDRDTRFFGITARLFSPDVCLGATVLLASYDDEPGARPQGTAPAPLVAAPAVVRWTPAKVPPTRGAAA